MKSKAGKHIYTFLHALMWIGMALLTGLVCGGVGTLFHKALDAAGELFYSKAWLLYLLPAAGLAVVGLYKLCRLPVSIGTDRVFESTREEGGVPARMAPLIFAGTFLTHLCGGSAGREGAALQLGAGIASAEGRLLRVDAHGMHVLEMCGMSALFAALFGTPAAAAFFAIEVVDVGRIRYKALLPCMLASVCAAYVSRVCGVMPTAFELGEGLLRYDVSDLARICALSVLLGAAAVLFCKTMQYSHTLFEKYIKNDYCRVLVSAAAVVLLTLISGTRDYNGAGMSVIRRALNGEALPFAWLLKLLFTALTLAGGFKGGEIVPAFFTGAALGCAAGGLLGLDAGVSAAIGMTALFCGVTNAPAAAIIMACEMFSGRYFAFFALAASVSFLISGKCSLYHSQKFLETKYAWDKEGE